MILEILSDYSITEKEELAAVLETVPGDIHTIGPDRLFEMLANERWDYVLLHRVMEKHYGRESIL